MDLNIASLLSLIDDPDVFLGITKNEVVNQLRLMTKKLFDFRVQQTNSDSIGDILPELYVDNFDNEQIFQQLELLNQAEISRHKKWARAYVSQNNSTEVSKKKVKHGNALKKHVHFSDDEGDDTGRGPEDSTIDAEDVAAQVGEDNEEDDDIGDVAAADEDDDESEEEKELQKLLDWMTDKQPAVDGEDDDEDDDLASDNESDNDSKKAAKRNSSDSDSDADDVDVTLNDASVNKLKNKLREMNQRKAKQTAKANRSSVDDHFFKLADMEAFLDEQDLKEQRAMHNKNKEESDGDNDLSEDEDDDEEEVATSYMYSDFFDPPDGEKDAANDARKHSALEHSIDAAKDDDNDADMDDDNKDDDSNVSGDEGSDKSGDEDDDDQDDDSGDDDDNGTDSAEDDEPHPKRLKQSSDEDQKETNTNVEPSSFEKRQEKLKHKITELEEGNLKAKSWQLTGEVLASARPENSLLQENLEFEFMTRQAPVITEATTKSLEDLIIQRIKDKAWDDVERKAKPTDKMVTYSKRVVLDQEKSKMSLSQIYEQQFLQQTQKSDEDSADKVDPKHSEIKKMMQSLFIKLDALANFHFTPKPIIQDIKIVSNVPALSLEEAIPTAVSDAALLAPEEVEAKNKRELVGKTEQTTTDKLRARRLKKKHQKAKKIHKEKLEKLKQVKGVKPGNMKNMQVISGLEKQSKKPKLGTKSPKKMSSKGLKTQKGVKTPKGVKTSR